MITIYQADTTGTLGLLPKPAKQRRRRLSRLAWQFSEPNSAAFRGSGVKGLSGGVWGTCCRLKNQFVMRYGTI